MTEQIALQCDGTLAAGVTRRVQRLVALDKLWFRSMVLDPASIYARLWSKRAALLGVRKSGTLLHHLLIRSVPHRLLKIVEHL